VHGIEAVVSIAAEAAIRGGIFGCMTVFSRSYSPRPWFAAQNIGEAADLNRRSG
jgi:hypothetical protein